jgi:4-diphosphocytidyl-2-C-methyl-D-erythritol kinase
MLTSSRAPDPTPNTAALTETAPAKINLYLHVVGRRPDGYHLLDSLVVFATTGDRLTFTPAPDLSLSIIGPFAAGLDPSPDNLVLRAAHALATEAKIAPSGRIVLEKYLPVASGIGGGSADAAATLRLLCRQWRVTLTSDQLHRIALSLGADVPVCLLGRPARMSGIGEHLRPAPQIPEVGIVLVNPGIGVATPAVFRARIGDFSTPAALPEIWPNAAALAATLKSTHNDLEAPAQHLAPVICDVLRAIAADPDCLLARMSGSGATCFGLFPSAAAAEAAVPGLRRSGWWVSGGAIQTD